MMLRLACLSLLCLPALASRTFALAPPEPAAPRAAPGTEQWRAARQALGRPLYKETNLELGRIRREFPTQISRIFFSAEPRWHVVVMLKRSSPVADRTVRAGGRSILIRILESQAYVTQHEVEARLARHHSRLMAILPMLQGVAVDVAAGEIFMRVYAEGRDVALVLARQKEVEALVSYPVRIVPTAGLVSLQDGVAGRPAAEASSRASR